MVRSKTVVAPCDMRDMSLLLHRLRALDAAAYEGAVYAQ